MLLLIATTVSAQTQQETKQCKMATNAADALQSFDWMAVKIDTAQMKQDSIRYAQRIEKMLQDQKKREAKKPD